LCVSWGGVGMFATHDLLFSHEPVSAFFDSSGGGGACLHLISLGPLANLAQHVKDEPQVANERNSDGQVASSAAL
jgi:hypothetical protein